MWLALAGCAAPAAGVTPAPAPIASVASPPSSAPQAASSALPAWAPPSLASMQAVGEGPSKHAGGRYLGRFYASDADAYRAEGEAPPGLVLCADLREASGQGALLLCMRKEHEGFRFAVRLAGAEGWSRLGALPECVACHSTAPRDGRFGL